MIQSMTGFGKIIVPIKNKKLSVELRSLNSKQADVFLRMPSKYRELEMDIRNNLKKWLKRGKIECIIDVDDEKGGHAEINTPLVKEYFSEFQQLSGELGLSVPDDQLLHTIMSMPQILTTAKEEIEDDEIELLHKGIATAAENLNAFRNQEGESLEQDLLHNVLDIEELLNKIAPFEEERIVRVRERLHSNLENTNIQFDAERFEQELLFYIEKFDINEEKVRLINHCNYFKETIKSKEISVGKKLGFIAQEMGREINTLGSKANHAMIQNIVVQMKESLEKVKEQVLNVL